MNLVASAMLRGMVGASSSADLSGVPGNRKARSAYGSDRTGAYESVQSYNGEDARAALKGVQTGSDTGDGSEGQGTSGWNPFRSRIDTVKISDAGRSTSGASTAQAASQDAAKTSTGSKLSLKA